MEIAAGRRVGVAIRKYLWAYLFIAGPVFGTAIFLFIPMISSFALSLTEWSGLQPPKFVGLANYQKLIFDDPKFVKSFVNTTIFVILGQGSGPVFGLLSALALNQKVRFRAAFRTAYFLPVMTSLVVVATVWKMLYNENGLINGLLRTVDLPTTRWLNNPSTALLSVIFTSVWQGFGFETVIFLAALQSIPQELYEAAMIDGANAWNRFWHVTLPGLRPVIVMIFIIGIIGSYQVFDQIYVMTDGGPVNSSRSIVFHLYDNFHYMKFGYASAVAYILFAILALFSFLQMRFLGRED